MASDRYRTFFLAGGTSLAFRFGHRTSVDIGLFSTVAFESSDLFTQIMVDFPKTQLLNQTRGSLYLDIGGIQVDLLYHPFPLLHEAEREDGYRLLSIHDVAAMKVNAVTNRGSKKDFIDLYTLHRQGVPLDESVRLFVRKYNGNRFLAIRSLLWFDDADTEPDPRFLNDYTWPMVRREMERIALNMVN